MGVRVYIILLHGRQPPTCKKLFNSHKWFVKGQTTKKIPHWVFPTQPLLPDCQCQLTTFTIWSNHYHLVSMSSCGGHILPSSPGPSPMTPTLENYDTNVHTQLLILICRPAISCSIIILYVLIVGLILKSALKLSNAP